MSGTSATAVDLSRLPPPAVIEVPSFDAVYADMLATLQRLDPTFTALVDSDPAAKILQIAAYREVLLRQRINDAARACMVPTATGADLDNLAVLFGVARLMIADVDPVANTPAVFEDDEALRRRILLASEGYTVAGPVGAYEYHALSADPQVLDASVISPAPGQVQVTILARAGQGVPDQALLDRVAAALSADTVRPLTDQVWVAPATIVPFEIAAALTVGEGPDSAVVLAAAQARLAAYLADIRRLGRTVRIAAINAALFVEGVRNVVITQPAEDLELPPTSAPWCAGAAVVIAGTGA